MSWSEAASAEPTLTGGGTEDSVISAQTAQGKYRFHVDGHNFINGDAGEIRVYQKVNTGATARIVEAFPFQHVWAKPNWNSKEYDVANGDIALKIVQSAGTGRSVCASCLIDPGSVVADIADGVWDEALSGHTSAGSAGKALGDIDTHTDTEIADIKAKTDSLTFTVAGYVDANTLKVGGTTQTAGDLAALVAASAIRAAIGLSSANLDTQLAAIAGYIDTEVAAILAAVDTEVAAIKAKTDNLPSDPADASDIAASFAALNDLSAADILAMVYEGSETFQDFLRGLRAFAYGDTENFASGFGTGIVFKSANGAKDRLTGDVDADGNRTMSATDFT